MHIRACVKLSVLPTVCGAGANLSSAGCWVVTSVLVSVAVMMTMLSIDCRTASGPTGGDSMIGVLIQISVMSLVLLAVGGSAPGPGGSCIQMSVLMGICIRLSVLPAPCIAVPSAANPCNLAALRVLAPCRCRALGLSCNVEGASVTSRRPRGCIQVQPCGAWRADPRAVSSPTNRSARAARCLVCMRNRCDMSWRRGLCIHI